MAKFQCTICGQIHEGLEAPEKCPVCKAPSSKFTVIDKGAQKATKLQKINEEDYEIIKKLETDGYVKAVEWYAKAAEQGNDLALYQLGCCYYSGHGIPKDEEEAIKCFKRAVKLGNDKAKGTLSELLLKRKKQKEEK